MLWEGTVVRYLSNTVKALRKGEDGPLAQKEKDECARYTLCVCCCFHALLRCLLCVYIRS